jgi:uncharacterized protein
MENIHDQRTNGIQSLSVPKAVVFSMHLIYRMLPNYGRFSAREHFGDIAVLNRAIVAAQNYLKGDANPDIEVMRESIFENCPDSEDFGSVYSTFALHAGIACMYLLDLIGKEDVKYAIEISNLSIEGLYIQVQETHLEDDMTLAEIEAGELMKAEVQFQMALLGRIVRSNLRDLESEIQANTYMVSNVGLGNET